MYLVDPRSRIMRSIDWDKEIDQNIEKERARREIEDETHT